MYNTISILIDTDEWDISSTGHHPSQGIKTSIQYITWIRFCCALCWFGYNTLQWRHNQRDGVSNHQPHNCLLNGLFRRRSKKTSTLCVIGLCAGNSPATGEFPAQRASNAENVSIWWRHRDQGVFHYIWRVPYMSLSEVINLWMVGPLWKIIVVI